MRFSTASARQFQASGDYRSALGHYLIALKNVSSGELEKYTPAVEKCLEKCVSGGLLSSKALQNLTNPLLTLFSGNFGIYCQLAVGLCNAGMPGEASKIYQLAEQECDASPVELCMARVLGANATTHVFSSWHMVMLNNLYRNSAYDQAISQIPAESSVLEIGSGTGILSVFSHRLGQKITSVEESHALCDITREVLEKNKSNDLQSLVIEGNSNEISCSSLNGTPDALISEIFDCCGFGEGIVKTFADAQRRLLKDGALVLPRRFSTYATLIQSQQIADCHSFKNFRSEYVNTGNSYAEDPYWCARLVDYPDFEALSTSYAIAEVDLTNVEELERLVDEGREGIVELSVTKTGVLHCVAVHFRAELAEGIELDSSSPHSCWDSGIYPLRHPKIVNKGDVIKVAYTISQEGRRLDLALQEEFNSAADVITWHSDAFRLAHDQSFIEDLAKMIPETSTTICLTRPFNHEESSLNKKFRSVRRQLVNLDEHHGLGYEEVLLRCDEIGRIVPPYDVVVWWPILADGSLDELEIYSKFWARQAQWKTQAQRDPVGEYPAPERQLKIVPETLYCWGQLVRSDRMAANCRLDPSSHLGVNVDCPDKAMQLFECRDINIDAYNVEFFSKEYPLFGISLQEISNFGPGQVDGKSHAIQMTATQFGEVDGVLYFWTTNGSYNSKDSQACSSFVFKRRTRVTVGQVLNLTVDLYKGQMLITLDTDRSRDDV